MAEPTEIMFTHKELVELMIKKQGLHEGIWMIALKFAMHATTFGSAPDADVLPTAIIPVLSIGIHRTEKESNLSVDAAKVNPLHSEPKMAFKRRSPH